MGCTHHQPQHLGDTSVLLDARDQYGGEAAFRLSLHCPPPPLNSSLSHGSSSLSILFHPTSQRDPGRRYQGPWSLVLHVLLHRLGVYPPISEVRPHKPWGHICCLRALHWPILASHILACCPEPCGSLQDPGFPMCLYDKCHHLDPPSLFHFLLSFPLRDTLSLL